MTTDRVKVLEPGVKEYNRSLMPLVEYNSNVSVLNLTFTFL